MHGFLLWCAAVACVLPLRSADLVSVWNGNTGWSVDITCGSSVPNPTDCPNGTHCSDSQCVASGSATRPSCAGCNYSGGGVVQCTVRVAPLGIGCWENIYNKKGRCKLRVRVRAGLIVVCMCVLMAAMTDPLFTPTFPPLSLPPPYLFLPLPPSLSPLLSHHML